MFLTAAHLSPEEERAFANYKANGQVGSVQFFTDALNTSLSCGAVLPSELASAKPILDGLFARSTLPKATLLYRATLDTYVAPHLAGGRLRYPAFMSTCLSEEGLTRHFSMPQRGAVAALLVIDAAAGASALDGEMRAGSVGNSLEEEVIFPAGAEFEVTSTADFPPNDIYFQSTLGFYAKNFSMLRVYRLRYGP